MSNTANVVQVANKTVSRPDVLRAIAECDRLGKVRFLRRYGYGTGRYALRHDGRSYPSKAILGVAAGLASSDFFGGARGAAGSLSRLGFEVRDVKLGCRVSRELDSLRRQVAKDPSFVVEPAWPELPVDPAAYFASGTNRAPEIAGAAAAGADIGVVAPEVSKASEAELVKLAGSDVLVFVDSGAFSEVGGSFPFPVVNPITPDQWKKRLGLYERLAAALGESVFLVAPDQVGDQAKTLERLELYADEIRRCAELGARILVPMQLGGDLVEFAEKVDSILGVEWFPAFPCKKSPVTAHQVREFVLSRRPRHVHLLGLGIRNKKAPAFLAALRGLCSVSLDSCWIGSAAGRRNGPGGGRRRLTIARDLAEDVLARVGSSRAVRELAVYAVLAGSGLVA